MPNELQFLGKLRFWSMVLAGVMLYLQQKGWIGESEALLIGGISAAFWATQTADSVATKIGKTEAAAVEEIKEEKKDKS